MLFSVLNHTATPMGTRLLKRWLQQPIADQNRLTARHNAIDAIGNLHSDLYDALRHITI